MSSVVTKKVGPEAKKTSERIPAAERRELILDAATAVFADRGYAGATTDQVAKAAGISQPYVVRMFGTKEKLFLEALDRALEKLFSMFRSVIAAYDAGELADQVAALDMAPDANRAEQLMPLIGAGYADLIEDRGILMMLMQAFVTGHEPAIGACAREGFLEVYRLIRDEAGFSPEAARDFLAQGMLMNTLLSIRLPEVYDESDIAVELLDCTLKTKLPLILQASREHRLIV